MARPWFINIANALRGLISGLAVNDFSGDPAEDWLTVKHELRATNQDELTRVAAQLGFLVAFRRGHRISAALSDEWLRDGAYTNARTALDLALAQEQILDGVEPPMGLQVVVSTRPRASSSTESSSSAKLVGSPRRRIIFRLARGDTALYPKSRRVLRVGITRAKVHTLILDPLWPQCPLLGGTSSKENSSSVGLARGVMT